MVQAQSPGATVYGLGRTWRIGPDVAANAGATRGIGLA
jgi:hypothetical protein